MEPPNSKSDSQILVQWEWKSNPNPFSQSEEAQWTPYTPFENFLLEKAYSNQQKEVNLGDYIVSTKDMIQKRKDGVSRQRPVRRNTEYIRDEEEFISNQEENIRSKRFFGAETPKTYNKAFGKLSDYLRFLQSRGPEIKQFATLLNEAEAAGNIDLLNNKIQPCLIECLQNEVKRIPVITDKKQQSQHQKYKKKLFRMFQESATSIKQFYEKVLKAFTMEGFLYRNLNHYLRNEDWIQLDSLLPYAYCLCKVFLRSEFASNLNNQEHASMTVYRGAQFDEIAFSFYDINVVKNFCWNSATSTSRKESVARRFMKINNSKQLLPVMFIIEVPLSLEKPAWIDISPYSVFKREEEIVLPPGSVFELTKVSRNDNNDIRIELRLLVNVDKLAHQGQIMHGAMQSEMAEDASLKLVCLEGRELSDAIAYLKGNELIEELEFCLCKFDDKVAAVSLEGLPRLKSAIFISSFTGDDKQCGVIFKQLRKIGIEKLKIYEGSFHYLLNILSQGIGTLSSLKFLTLTFARCDDMADRGLKNLSSQGFKYLTSLISLDLNLGGCSHITDRGLTKLSSQGLRYLTSLTSLTLSFQGCSQITDEGLKSLSFGGLISLTSLTSLTLYFGECSEISDEGLGYQGRLGFTNLTSLTSLTLSFGHCTKITDQGLKNLGRHVCRGFTSLISLALDFRYCDQITDEGLKELCRLSYGSLTPLTSLTLYFAGCSKITDEGLKELSLLGFGNLTSLTSLALDFRYCDRITDEGLKNLCMLRFGNLTSLSSLTLDLCYCDQITDEGLKELYLLGLGNLTSLISLALDFDFCDPTIYEELEKLEELCLLRFGNLTSLTSLTIHFEHCTKITDEGKKSLQRLLKLNSSPPTEDHQSIECASFVRNLKSQDIDLKEKHLHKGVSGSANIIILKSKDDFERFSRNIQDGHSQKVLAASRNLLMKGDKTLVIKAISCLRKESIRHGTFLTCLNLDFSSDTAMTDEGLQNLSSQGLRYLTSLTSLTLNFHSCHQITDEGLDNLSSQGLKYLTSLKSLALDFAECPEITDDGLNNLSLQGLKYLTSLTSLALYFVGCSEIRDEGLIHLSFQGLKYLTSLNFLTLNFQKCHKIHFSAWNDFLKVLKYFGYEISKENTLKPTI